MNILFLSSGNGGNLKFMYLLNQVAKDFDVHLSVIADRTCGALNFAKKNGLQNEIIEIKKLKDQEFIFKVESYRPAIIFTTIHKILSTKFLQKFGDRLVNLHYSLLPNYAGTIGMEGVRLATLRQDFLLGVTTHKLIDEVDKGEPIIQSVFKNPNNRRLSEQITFRIGCNQIYSIVLSRSTQCTVVERNEINTVLNQNVHHIPYVLSLPTVVNERFWSHLEMI